MTGASHLRLEYGRVYQSVSSGRFQLGWGPWYSLVDESSHCD